jgi:glucose-6-phosphate 1-dehydrogenase
MAELARSDAVVLFGATGDLARRRIWPAVYHLEERGLLTGPLIGVAGSSWSDEELVGRATEAVAEAGVDPDAAVLSRLAERLRYVSGDYAGDDVFDRLADEVGHARCPLFYLAIPPGMFNAVIRGLVAHRLNRRGRIVVEKPFGRDRGSAHELNSVVQKAFPESAIFRIDHFLGKDPVENLLVFRFANSMLEPIWNRRYIARVEITMAEALGIESRGRFYESVGALRDVVQNHLLQIVAFLAMEPPVASDAAALRDEKFKLFRQVRSFDPEHVVRGQYRRYRDEPGVKPDSDVETFVAVRFEIDSWRWAGVPWYIRTGKRLAANRTEAIIEFQRPPRLLFLPRDAPVPHPNHLRFGLGRDGGVSLHLQAKAAGEHLVSAPVELEITHGEDIKGQREAYERLLEDAMAGDPTRFGRADSIDEQWRIVQPVLDAPPPVQLYEAATWGPPAADALIADQAGWHPV